MFWLDPCLKQGVQEHCDKHVVKMPLEMAQLLSGAHHLNGSVQSCNVYKLSHKAHPCMKWVSSSTEAYSACYSMFEALCAEYTYRYGKIHKSWRDKSEILRLNPCPDIPAMNPPQCMPDIYKSDCLYQAYRTYYINDKQHIASWTKRPAPDWFVFL